LVEQTKKAGIKAQKKLAHEEKVRKNELKSQLEKLKENFIQNQEKIC
jgi:hypothetical protein